MTEQKINDVVLELNDDEIDSISGGIVCGGLCVGALFVGGVALGSAVVAGAYLLAKKS